MVSYQTDQIPTVTQTVMTAIGVTFVVGVIYDVAAYALGGNDATLSRAMMQVGFSWPIVIVAWGGLGAHFFCPDDSRWTGWWSEIKPYVLMCMGMLVFRLAWVQVIVRGE